MKIVEIREKTVPIASPIRNAYIDFSKMTLSLVAVVTDVVRDGKPVVGFGFNSNGRYAPQGLLHERFIQRLKAAKPEEIVDDRGRHTVLFRQGLVVNASSPEHPDLLAYLVARGLIPEAAVPGISPRATR